MSKKRFIYHEDPTTYHRKLTADSGRYKALHPKSWEMDFRVAELLEQGRTMLEIAQEAHCYESTAYRAKERIEDFLFPGKEDLDVLKQYVEDNPPDFGDREAVSILEMLYSHYGEYNRFDTDAIREGFETLYKQLEGKSLQEMDPVIYTTSLLCRDHEKAGFLEGVKVGIRLSEELYY